MRHVVAPVSRSSSRTERSILFLPQLRQRRRDVQVGGRDAEDGGDAGAHRGGVDPPAARRTDPPTAHGPVCTGKTSRITRHTETYEFRCVLSSKFRRDVFSNMSNFFCDVYSFPTRRAILQSTCLHSLAMRLDFEWPVGMSRSSTALRCIEDPLALRGRAS